MNLSVMSDSSERIHYQDPAVPIYIAQGNLRDLSGMAALCHWHEDVEFLLPYKGYLSYNVNGHQVQVAEGNAIFVNSRQMHYGHTSDGTDCEYHCLCFKPELLRAAPALYERYVTPILASGGLPWLLLEADNPQHRELLDLLRRIGSTKARDLGLLGLLCGLWQGIYALAEPEPSAADDGDLGAMRQMLRFITTGYRERISLDRIAAAGGVCRSRCCEIFKKYMGRTVNDYLTSFRLERAMELLREPGVNITEVANACGFGSPSYFAKVFIAQKGCTPTEYRRSYLRREKGHDVKK